MKSKHEQAWADLYASTYRIPPTFFEGILLALTLGLIAGLAAGLFFFMQ